MNRNRRVLNGASCGTMAIVTTSDGLATRDVDFAYVLVRDDPLEAAPDLLAQVLDCAHDSGGDVVSCDASLVLVAFGWTKDALPSEGQREAFARSIEEKLGKRASCVHGRRKCLVGTVGGEHRKSYTLLFSGCREVLLDLASTPLGTVKVVQG